MKKEALIISSFLSFIFLIPLLSAQSFGSYGFSFADLFSSIDAQTIFILVCFGVLGLLLKTILDRFPAFHGTTAGIMSVLLSLGMTWGMNKWLNVNSLFSSFGFSGDILPYLLIALLVIFVVCLFLFKYWTLIFSGVLLILIALFTDWFYEKGIVLVTGIILLLIGFSWWWSSKKGKGIFAWLMILSGLILLAYGLYTKDTLLSIIGGILFLIGIIIKKIKKKTDWDKIPQTPQEKIVYQQRTRSLYDLKQKYMAYLFAYNRRGLTKHQRKRILKAMKIIIKYAKDVGVSQGEFLSSKIGGSNAKAPEDLKAPFDG